MTGRSITSITVTQQGSLIAQEHVQHVASVGSLGTQVAGSCARVRHQGLRRKGIAEIGLHNGFGPAMTTRWELVD